MFTIKYTHGTATALVRRDKEGRPIRSLQDGTYWYQQVRCDKCHKVTRISGMGIHLKHCKGEQA